MNRYAKTKRTALTMSLAALMALALLTAKASAHGGEDHGEKQAPVVSTGAGVITHVARTGDLEITVKHPPLEPDKETTARVFATRFATNEPIGNAKIAVTLASDGNALVEAFAAAAATTPGMYEAKLPPLPKGAYKLTARIEQQGESSTAEYGALQVAPLPASSTVGSASVWARNLLIGLAALVCLALIGIVIYRFTQKSPQNQDRAKGQPATA
ncbi:MAG: hypothetical protein ABR577_14180 [Pyrinomonadaceae bacterium]